jgi:hypothetical protein
MKCNVCMYVCNQHVCSRLWGYSLLNVGDGIEIVVFWDIPTFQRNLLHLQGRRGSWGQQLPPKHWYLPTKPHGVTSQKFIILILTAMGNYNIEEYLQNETGLIYSVNYINFSKWTRWVLFIFRYFYQKTWLATRF